MQLASFPIVGLRNKPYVSLRQATEGYKKAVT